MVEPEKKNTVKIMILGDQAVGKSSLLMRYCEDKFSLNMMGTAGIDFKRKIIDFRSTKINVLFYDSAGHDRFRHLIKQHYHGAKGIILVYDVTDSSSFNNVTEWMKNIKENADGHSEILLIGNKMDLTSERVVSKEQGEEVAKQYDNIKAYETSAKTGENTGEAFLNLVHRILENKSIDKGFKFKDEEEIENKKELIKQEDGKEIKSDPKKQKDKKPSGGCCVIY